MAVPKVRFPGFTDDWEQRKFSDVFDFLNNNTLSRAELNYNSGTVHNVHYGDILIKFGELLDASAEALPFITDPGKSAKSAKSRLADGDVVIADTAEDETVGKCTEIANVGSSVVVSGLHTMPCRPHQKFGCGYLGFYMNSGAYHNQLVPLMQGIKVTSISRSAIADTILSFPTDIVEQEKIGALFTSIDNTLTLHQRKLDDLKALKKSMLQKMFPAEGEDVPEIRFPGFTDDWEQRKLGELGKCQSGIGFPDAEQGGLEGVPFFKVSDMNNPGNENEMLTANNYVTAEQIARKKWKPVTEVPAMFFAKVGAAVMLNRKRLCRFPFLLDNNTMAYKFGEEWDAQFGKTLFETINLPSLVQVGALPSYNAGDVEGIEIFMPPTRAEQEKIGSFFAELDNTITLHQHKLDDLKMLKQALLQQMFI